jgi:hypothetical protein
MERGDRAALGYRPLKQRQGGSQRPRLARQD